MDNTESPSINDEIIDGLNCSQSDLEHLQQQDIDDLDAKSNKIIQSIMRDCDKKTTINYYNINRASADGIQLLLKSFDLHFKKLTIVFEFDNILDTLLDSSSMPEEQKNYVRNNKRSINDSEHYLSSVENYYKMCMKFYHQSNLTLEKNKHITNKKLYYSFYNFHCICEIANRNQTIAVDSIDMMEGFVREKTALVKNVITSKVRKYTIKKTYIVENTTPSLYNIIQIDNQNYLVQYSLIGIQILKEVISKVRDYDAGWDNDDAYLVPYYNFPHIKKIMDKNLLNGKRGLYSSSLYLIRDNIKLPNITKTKLVSPIETPTINITHSTDYNITNEFIKKVKSNVDKPLLNDDELMNLFEKMPNKSKSKSKSKSPNKYKSTSTSNDKTNESPNDIPTYLPVDMTYNDISSDDETTDTTDKTDKSPSINDKTDINDKSPNDNETIEEPIETIDEIQSETYDLLTKTFNSRFVFENENNILMNNYYSNSRIRQLLDENDIICFEKPITKYYKTRMRYFNMCLKTNSSKSNQYHCYINENDIIYSITEIVNILDR